MTRRAGIAYALGLALVLALLSGPGTAWAREGGGGYLIAVEPGPFGAGSFRWAGTDAAVEGWVDPAEETSASAEPGQVIEVRGWGATCRVIGPSGEVVSAARVWPWRHAWCATPGGVNPTGPDPAP